MAMEYILLLMAVSTKDHGLKIRSTAKENILLLMAIIMKDNG